MPEHEASVKADIIALSRAAVVLCISSIAALGYVHLWKDSPFPLSFPAMHLPSLFTGHAQEQRPSPDQRGPNATFGTQGQNVPAIGSTTKDGARTHPSVRDYDEQLTHKRQHTTNLGSEASVNHMLNEANRLFGDGQYQQALAQCEVILRRDPRNASALELKRRVETTIHILGR